MLNKIEKSRVCPICKIICSNEEEKHRHMEEKHNNMFGQDQELLEKTAGKEILNEVI